jgi:hypothetical protein
MAAKSSVFLCLAFMFCRGLNAREPLNNVASAVVIQRFSKNFYKVEEQIGYAENISYRLRLA